MILMDVSIVGNRILNSQTDEIMNVNCAPMLSFKVSLKSPNAAHVIYFEYLGNY